jgi:hypothetical protein
MNRSQIETRIAQILNRADLTTYIPLWFDTAHEDIQRLMNFICMQSTYEADFVDNVEQYDAPSNMKEPIMVYSYDPVIGKPTNFYELTDLANVRMSRFLDPRTFPSFDLFFTSHSGRFQIALWGGKLELFPNPGILQHGKKLRLDYYRYLTVATGATNFFTEHAFDYLIYRALREAGPFLAGDARIATWKGQEDTAEKRVQGSNIASLIAGPLQMRG